jgi:hypothetical protein
VIAERAAVDRVLTTGNGQRRRHVDARDGHRFRFDRAARSHLGLTGKAESVGHGIEFATLEHEGSDQQQRAQPKRRFFSLVQDTLPE